MNKVSIGTMQGRLLPKFQGRYSAHPLGYWKDEFPLAANLGLENIEFILDFNDVSLNPLMDSKGVDEILSLSLKTGIKVKKVCANYFMEAPLHSLSREVAKESQKVLHSLIRNSRQLCITDIVIPCEGQSSLIDKGSKERFIENIQSSIELAETLDINLSLETDLAPSPFAELLEELKSPIISINYDTGNSASLGYDPVEELLAYGNRISGIHIKDRKYREGSTILGTGDTNFELFFRELKKINYKGPFIMEVYRDDEGIEVFKRQLDWVKPKILEYATNY
jgi:L-ribulose-5-phosphate 3-epimerase